MRRYELSAISFQPSAISHQPSAIGSGEIVDPHYRTIILNLFWQEPVRRGARL